MDVPFGGIIACLLRKWLRQVGPIFQCTSPRPYQSQTFLALPFSHEVAGGLVLLTQTQIQPNINKIPQQKHPSLGPAIPVRVPPMVNLAKHWAPHVPILSYLHVIQTLSSLFRIACTRQTLNIHVVKFVITDKPNKIENPPRGTRKSYDVHKKQKQKLHHETIFI